jgi:NAD(P)-dependent dehydrogenase (short-subunit alcohol dehydrogenase family)
MAQPDELSSVPSMPDTFLRGKTALVTGASRNLGAVIAERLASHGAAVAVNYNSSERDGRELVERLRAQSGEDHVALPGNMASSQEVSSLVVAALDHLGRIDVLVNNAGPWAGDPFTELSEEDWDLVWNANVKAAYITSQLVAPSMRKAGWGRIINISAGSRYVRNNSIYGLAKDALAFLTEELACELGPEVTVNAVAPGQIAESAPDVEEFDPDYIGRAIASTPAGRLVTRSEVAELVALLCSPPLAMVTGATIPIDGGWRFHRF